MQEHSKASSAASPRFAWRRSSREQTRSTSTRACWRSTPQRSGSERTRTTRCVPSMSHRPAAGPLRRQASAGTRRPLTVETTDRSDTRTVIASTERKSRMTRLKSLSTWCLVVAGAMVLALAAPAFGACLVGDSDCDGTLDAFDLCPGTVALELVDTTGCSVCPCDGPSAGVPWASHTAYV